MTDIDAETAPQEMADPVAQQNGKNEKIHIPTPLPILPLSNFVVFPNAVGPIAVKNEVYARMINEAAVKDRFLGLSLIRTDKTETPTADDLCRVGTAARIIKLMNIADGEVSFICQGLSRIQITGFVQTEPYFIADIVQIDETAERSDEFDALLTTLRNQFIRLVDVSPQLPDQLKIVVMNLNDYVRVIDFVVANSTPDVIKQQEILEERRIRERFKKALAIVQTEIHKAELSNKIQSEIAKEFSERQREHFLREQLKKIQAELGDKDDQQIELENLRKKIADAHMSEEAEKAALREVDRLAMMSPAAAEYSVARTYIEWLTDLPWSITTEDRLDIAEVEATLDRDHYDLEKVKKRILEYVAVRKLKRDMKGPILCFYGPPGVGKTSLGRSIATALGRKFVRISLGGVRDEAEIRGHRRTYVGALPGRIIQGLKKAGSNNPVFMLDEIDKLGMDFRGDPSSALLEVLDPEQNNAFSDHYLEVAFDLSNVFFITTANILDTIPPALRDRLEVLELPGYTEVEKLHIAKTYLLQRQIEEHGLKPDHITITDAAIKKIIREYTREAGVRNLEREIASVCRGVARKIATGTSTSEIVDEHDLIGYLGQPRFFSEIAERITVPGIATGLAWTPAGGDILFVEATKMPGSKGLIITGQLGDVMKESAQAALSYVRANAQALGIDPLFYKKFDIHLHVPAGAIPKDGPSAGVTMACALTSLLTDRLVRSDVAMTGEITLRGKVLPIGGVKEKVLAAKRAGIKIVILPKLNKKDLDETPDTVKSDMKFVFVDTIDEVIRTALRTPRTNKIKKK
ncbi:MAG: endopeptidase La [Desulfobacterota bacterium]|nr:endopeptidase La [Thermodesulfobacteriota bacterium]